ncbi:MAG TPA: hypothetical protein DDW48_01080 [Methyloceanibacter sp.]|nr:hypothetical protein [Methyloceanibacter sp.]
MGTIGSATLMMSLPFVLFACAIGAAWLRQRGMSVGFWLVGLVTMLILFRIHVTEVLSIQL